MTSLKVHFRGVGVYVAKNGCMTDVLFPRSDKEPTRPDDDLQTDSYLPPSSAAVVDRFSMKHADETDAIPHYSGVIVIRNGVEEPARTLMGMKVDLEGATTEGVTMDPNPPDNIPDLDDIITDTDADKQLVLRDFEKNKENRKRLATHVVLNGFDGDTVVARCPSGGKWRFDEPNGKTTKDEDYNLEVLWSLNATNPVTFRITSLQTGHEQKPAIVVDSSAELYFFHFESGTPTVGDLTRTRDVSVDTPDHDFKWVYKLFKPINKNTKTWRNWLNQTWFPAPVRKDSAVVSVSTCFELLWTGVVDSE